jgi:TRAP-type mannitol/chloroaromatic compound transport system permease small subunit
MRRLILITRWIDRLNERIGQWTAWLTLAMVLIGSYNAIMRYIGRSLHRDITSNAYLELQWYLFSIVFLLGAAYTLRHNAHVHVDVFFGRLTRRAQARIYLIGHLLFLLPFCIILLWLSWTPVVNSWTIREISPDPGGLPRYPIKLLVPIAFLLLLLQGCSNAIKEWLILRGTPLEETGPGGHA